MIPAIIHQTWRNSDLPVPTRLPQSWQDKNPAWEYRFWTDADLENLVRAHYPDLLDLYLGVAKPVQRADIARYLIMHRFGGLYADIDTECLASLDFLLGESRVVLSEEPREHWDIARLRAMPYLLFNGTFASPAGHRFWDHVITVLKRQKNARKDVLESTGPLMFSGAAQSFDSPEQLAISSCHLFNPMCKDGSTSNSAPGGAFAQHRASVHFWDGSWLDARSISPLKRVNRWLDHLRKPIWQGIYLATRGRALNKAGVGVDKARLAAPLPKGDTPEIAVLIPVRDAAQHLPRCFELLLGLDYPKNRLKLVFCEGDSRDNTVAVLDGLVNRHGAAFKAVRCLTLHTGNKLPRAGRWKPELQKKRRSGLARVRNYLVANGLEQGDDWALWIDADVCDYPADIVQTLLAQRHKIVTPDCVVQENGPSYDMNAFLDLGSPRNLSYYRHAVGGIFQPPVNYWWRRHLHDLRYLDQVPLSSVGGTMLLVHAEVHRAGVDFPEIPYNDLLETEGFGAMAADFGVQPVGLPNVHIRHVDE